MERAATVMAALAYVAYLVALLTSPLLVQWRWGRALPWRWGLALALEVTVAELALVYVVTALALYLLPPRHHVGVPLPVLLGALSGMAVLIGGGLASAWVTISSIRRATGRLP
jgi:hypothetical protein